MSDHNMKTNNEVSDWWSTDIIEMAPGVIRFRGQPIQELIGKFSFAQMIWYMVIGDELSPARARLFEATLVAPVDHGPQAPSIAISRMASTCGIGLNNAMASAINVLGDAHGGAGEQCVELFELVNSKKQDGLSLEEATRVGLDEYIAEHGKYLPGYGHRFHKPVDPRTPVLLGLVDEAAKEGAVSGDYAAIGRQIEKELADRRDGRPIPMNVDGSTAVIYAELGVPAPLARGFFCLTRSVGILAHAWEQSQQPTRNKGPIPRDYLPTYTGKKYEG